MTTTWTPIPKPTNPAQIVGGDPIGLLIALTYSSVVSGSIWTPVAKASGTAWTAVPKAD